jgi:xylulokinase
MSVIALDIGTSRTKALLASWDGRIASARSAATPVIVGAGGRHEFPAGAVRATVERLVLELASARPGEPVDTIVFSSLGTAMVPLDRSGRPLGTALSPADARPGRVLGLMGRVDLAEGRLFELTGSDPRLPSFLLHWLWWRQERPEVMRGLHRFRSLRGFVVAGLSGADAEDPSWASRTMLMDLATDTWSDTILAAADLPADALPAIVPSTTAWPVSRAVARRLALSPDALVVLGAMDNCCAFLGATDPGEERLVNIAGTYEHMAGVGTLPVVRAAALAVEGLVHRYLLPGRFLSYSRVPLGLLLAEVEASSPGGLDRLLDGLSPDPLGPEVRPDLPSVRAWLQAGMPPAEVLQALMESCGTILVRYVDAWTAAGGLVDRIVAVGGGAAQAPALQLKANLLDCPVSTLASDEGAALGALRLAAMAVRGCSPAEACRLFPNPVLRTWSPRDRQPATDA